MNYKISNAINDARDYFDISKYPGNFFQYIIDDRNYIKKYKILLFKQYLGESNSGFIDYANNGLAYICINHRNTIGHQNFTLAHEIGHYFLHKGEYCSDTDKTISISKKNTDKLEQEANEFAAEFLYPLEYVSKDIKNIFSKKLICEGNELELADYVNGICETYFISFKFALCRILFESEWHNNNNVINKVEKVSKCVGSLNERYKNGLYLRNPENEFCKPYVGPYFAMKDYINTLVDKKEMGSESGEAILDKNSELEGLDEKFN
ncbi:TPA: ImmA/IrrE family metallo-endopeptidase [Clostridium botulinum]|nr:ImmA/IrrE family metallo-endopeptidase [Clostridium botulinum]HDK7143654.1 ImmA/IrrE family metallo-endopeptidase [Clostridium botulinum]HDK7147300.1 ImmA/IrrE family metallo-endopeptidase [Clostridium botulinum]HDK7151042.1 ImmA/IrrE family metallo-endopeptidase [Clostridium botulinum]HDK7154628.1 ImmA/IrrE family metallo-endopeptidase [Clostridium botulinum]